YIFTNQKINQMNKKYVFLGFTAFVSVTINAQNFQQNKQAVYNQIINEVETNNQLEHLAFELLDEIGPRLVGSPEMEKAHDWVVSTYADWNIKAENIPYGEWKSWQRGTTEITMTSPRIKSIEGTQLAWNSNTKKAAEAEVVTMPAFQSKVEFETWANAVKGEIVMISQYQRSGRAENQWKEHATEEDFDTYKKEKTDELTAWNNSIKATGKS